MFRSEKDRRDAGDVPLVFGHPPSLWIFAAAYLIWCLLAPDW